MRTSFHHQPEAQHPKSSAIHKLPADYPIFGSLGDMAARFAMSALPRWSQPIDATLYLKRKRWSVW